LYGTNPQLRAIGKTSYITIENKFFPFSLKVCWETKEKKNIGSSSLDFKGFGNELCWRKP